MASQDFTRWWYAAEAALALAVVALPLCLGGAPWWTSQVMLALAVLATTTWLVGGWRHRRRVTWHPVLLLPLGLALVAGASLVPLPESLLQVLSPAHAELRDFALVPLGLEASRPLTLDAPSTWRALVRIVSVGLLLFVALQLGRLDHSRKRLLGVVAMTGTLVAVVGFAHLLTGADALFGVWRYFATVPLMSFFGNTNHLAAFLAFASTVALALALDASSREVALGWAGAAVASGLGVFLTLSRGGIASFVVTWGLVGVVVLARRQGGLRSVVPWVAIAGTTLFALALASEQLFERMASVATLERLQRTKLELWPMFWSGAAAHWRAGMGLGAFELGFGRWQTEQLEVTFTHPENIVLQWVSELGVPLSVLLVLVIAWLAVRLVRASRERLLEQVLLTAVVGLLIHEVFDFALELNALPVALVVVVGVVAARDEAQDEPSRWTVRRPWFALPLLSVLVGLVATARGLPTHAALETTVGEAASSMSLPAFRELVTKAVDRHPASWVVYSHAAARMATEGAPRESLAWVNRVLFLRPRDARAHASAGRALLRLGQSSQALLEFKTAWVLGESSSFDEGLELAARLRAWDRLLVEERGLLSRAWNRYRSLGRGDDAMALLRAVEELPPSEAVAAEARELAVWDMAGRADASGALLALGGLPAEVRENPDFVVLEARLLSQLGRSPEGIGRLDAALKKRPGELAIGLALVELLAGARRGTEARTVLDRLRPFQPGPQARSQLFQREAELWILDERWPRALDALQSAARIEPQRADLKYRIATVYERMGSLHAALDEVRRGRLLDSPEGAKAQDPWVARLESQLATSAE